MLNELVYNLAVMLDDTSWSTLLHESYYMYNWVESTHVLFLMVSLGTLFVIDFRMLGLAFTNVPASQVASRLTWPMIIGFTVMFATGILLFYAVPVRSTQSIWFRIKMVLLVCAAVNAWLFHKRMNESVATWENDSKAPSRIRQGAMLSLAFWSIIVICGRFIAYDWFDCERQPGAFMSVMAGCVDGQTRF
ncbi:MAG: DUF6644 family protein [Pseudohongiellaceae bacterium]